MACNSTCRSDHSAFRSASRSRAPSVTGAPVTEGALLRLADLKAEWSERQVELQAIKTGYIDVINEWARLQDVPHVASPGQ